MKTFFIGLFALLIISTFFAFNKNLSSKSKPITTINATLNGIDKNLALMMIQNFHTYRSNDKGKKSFSVWFSIAEIAAINNLLKAEETSRQTDGLRFYFGSDAPIAPSAKLHLKILLVPTITKTPNPPDHLSTHGDYYDHTGTFPENFLVSETGVTINDQADIAALLGAHLFNPVEPTTGSCNTTPTQHYISTHLAYEWVNKRNERNPDDGSRDDFGYNTESDWFKLCFITSLFNVITTPANNLDGLRIYLGEGVQDDGLSHDVVILVPTHKEGTQMAVDDYNCMEDLAIANGAPFCTEKDTSSFGGGYDKGELCPTICN